MKPAAFKTEADLCSAFIATLPSEWTAYPETAGWDILLVHATGIQVGVQAKLVLNTKVVHQAAEGFWAATTSGPDYRAILVPEATNEALKQIAGMLGITTITMHSTSRGLYHNRNRATGQWESAPKLPPEISAHYDYWHDFCPVRRCTLPDYVPDVKAGDTAPLRLTAWKVKAIKVQVIIETRGYITRHDFKVLNLDPRRWLHPSNWLVQGAHRGHYIRGPHLPDFRRQHPRNFAEIAADAARWMPALPA